MQSHHLVFIMSCISLLWKLCSRLWEHWFASIQTQQHLWFKHQNTFLTLETVVFKKLSKLLLTSCFQTLDLQHTVFMASWLVLEMDLLASGPVSLELHPYCTIIPHPVIYVPTPTFSAKAEEDVCPLKVRSVEVKMMDGQVTHLSFTQED